MGLCSRAFSLSLSLLGDKGGPVEPKMEPSAPLSFHSSELTVLKWWRWLLFHHLFTRLNNHGWLSADSVPMDGLISYFILKCSGLPSPWRWPSSFNRPWVLLVKHGSPTALSSGWNSDWYFWIESQWIVNHWLIDSVGRFPNVNSMDERYPFLILIELLIWAVLIIYHFIYSFTSTAVMASLLDKWLFSMQLARQMNREASTRPLLTCQLSAALRFIVDMEAIWIEFSQRDSRVADCW